VWGLVAGIVIASVRKPAARLISGIDFAGKQVLRFGVALLGLQITAAAFHVLSLASVAAIVADITILLLAAWYLGPLIGLDRKLALVLAGSVAICGASAAAAFA